MFNNNNDQQQRIFQDPEDTDIFEEINGIYLSDLEKDFLLNYDIVDLNIKFLDDIKLFYNKIQYYKEVKEEINTLKGNKENYIIGEYKIKLMDLKYEQFGTLQDLFLSLEVLVTNLIVQKIFNNNEPEDICILGIKDTDEVINFINDLISEFQNNFENNKILKSEENLFLDGCEYIIVKVRNTLGLGYKLYLDKI